MTKSKNVASYKSGIKEWAPLPLDKINQNTTPNQVFSPSNFNDNDMADDVLVNVPPQQSSGVVGSRTFFRDSKK